MNSRVYSWFGMVSVISAAIYDVQNAVYNPNGKTALRVANLDYNWTGNRDLSFVLEGRVMIGLMQRSAINE